MLNYLTITNIKQLFFLIIFPRDDVGTQCANQDASSLKVSPNRTGGVAFMAFKSFIFWPLIKVPPARPISGMSETSEPKYTISPALVQIWAAAWDHICVKNGDI